VYYFLIKSIQEEEIEEKIVEVKASCLSEERKAKLILRKETQLRKTLLTKATAFYNAAAGFFNSGMREKAVICAQKASQHPSFGQKAEELIERIKGMK